MKQLRIDFPDYIAENQERDAERYAERQKKDVYIVKTLGKYGAYFTSEDLSINSKDGEEFTHFIKRMEIFSINILRFKPKFHCVLNKGIEELLRQHIVIQKMLNDK